MSMSLTFNENYKRKWHRTAYLELFTTFKYASCYE